MIPGDPEQRWWIEASGANPDIAASLRPALVAFIGFDRDHVPQIAGTGFIISGDTEKALVLSAKHVLTEGIVRIQRPHAGYASSALFIGAHHTMPSLDARRFRAVWMNNSTASMLPAVHAFYNDTLDIAGCLLVPQKGETLTGSVTIPLDVHVPSVGDVVHMVSLDALSITETTLGRDRSGDQQQITVTRRVSLRVGVVTAVYPQGYRQFRWPCFTTSIPAVGGMSGGFVYLPREGITIAACGIVSADCSSPESHNDFSLCGESVIACAWPGLALRVSESLPQPDDATTFSLLEMMMNGNIHKAIGGHERVTIDDLGNDHFTIRLAA